MKESMLVASTANIEMSTAEFLQEQVNESTVMELVVYQKHEFGYFLPVTDFIFAIEERLPKSLFDLLVRAKEEECTWLMLDRDYPELDDHPVYPWN